MKRLLALALALAGGAAAAPPGSPLTPARDNAAVFAVTHGMVVDNLAANCRRFSDRLKVDPDAALAAWRRRNLERASAAESYLIYAHAAIERELGAAAAERFNANTRALARQKANVALNDIFERTAPQFEVCERWMDAIYRGQADLGYEVKYRATLDELVRFERDIRQGRPGP
ncbi:MAG TPA: hypothetical protein VFV84_11640 [Burkholderiales bacterium]|nr:hypothetical protein [Burkholderiales bacterium]